MVEATVRLNYLYVRYALTNGTAQRTIKGGSYSSQYQNLYVSRVCLSDFNLKNYHP